MSQRSRTLIAAALFAFALGISSANVAHAQDGPSLSPQAAAAVRSHKLLSAASDEVAAVIRSGKLAGLRPLLATHRLTFEKTGEVYVVLDCYLNSRVCPEYLLKKSPVQDILKGRYFKYYDHVNSEFVIVSYIRESARVEFNKDPGTFLENRFNTDFFSCAFVFSNGKWWLKESVCFLETEAPYGEEPG